MTGIAPQRDYSPIHFGNYSIFIHVPYKIFGLAFDAHFKRRNLYWTVPNSYGVKDGAIYYANVDQRNPTVNSLAGVIGQVCYVCYAFDV